MSAFHDSLAALCKKEAALAEASDDRRVGYTDMIIELSAALGRTVALATDGQAEVNEKLMVTIIEDVKSEVNEKSARLRFARTITKGSS